MAGLSIGYKCSSLQQSVLVLCLYSLASLPLYHTLADFSASFYFLYKEFFTKPILLLHMGDSNTKINAP